MATFFTFNLIIMDDLTLEEKDHAILTLLTNSNDRNDLVLATDITEVGTVLSLVFEKLKESVKVRYVVQPTRKMTRFGRRTWHNPTLLCKHDFDVERNDYDIYREEIKMRFGNFKVELKTERQYVNRKVYTMQRSGTIELYRVLRRLDKPRKWQLEFSSLFNQLLNAEKFPKLR